MRGTATIYGGTSVAELNLIDLRPGGHGYTFAGGSSAAGNLDIFDQTFGAARLTISATGNVGIGTTTPQALFHVNGNILANGIGVGIGTAAPQEAIDLYGDIIYRGNGFWMAGISSSDTFGFWTSLNSTAIAYIDTSGNYHQASDLQLKRDIVRLDNALDRLLQLHPVSYHLRGAANAPLSLGFIAQEVQPLFPEVVGEQPDGTKDLAYGELIPVTIRSIQELNQKLETRLKQKEADIQELKAILERLEQLISEKKVGAK